MASGDWGGGGAPLPRIVKRTQNVTKKVTSTRAARDEIPGETPPLKYYASAVYYKQPSDPDFAKQEAKGTQRIEHGR